jgi:hypothetical protein
MPRLKYRLGSIMLFGVLAVGLLAAPLSAWAQAVTRAYTSDGTMQRGMIVKISDKDSGKVEALSTKETDDMEGVVVAANDSPVTISDTDPENSQVFVANSGHYQVLVSDQNGVIKNNDYLTISSVAGVAMKSDKSQTIVVGKALAGFDGKTNVSGTTTLTDNRGNTTQTSIGLIPVDINISRNPLQSGFNSSVPGLQSLHAGAQAIVNKPVDPARFYVAIILLLMITGIGGSLLYSGVRNGFVAIGRNPLAKKSITRSLIQVVITSVIIFIIGLVGVYLILKL